MSLYPKPVCSGRRLQCNLGHRRPLALRILLLADVPSERGMIVVILEGGVAVCLTLKTGE